jgi:hypothetical protein
MKPAEAEQRRHDGGKPEVPVAAGIVRRHLDRVRQAGKIRPTDACDKQAHVTMRIRRPGFDESRPAIEGCRPLAAIRGDLSEAPERQLGRGIPRDGGFEQLFGVGKPLL